MLTGNLTVSEGTPTGTHVDLFGLDTYVVGEEKGRVIVIITDIFGNRYNNVLLLADQFAKHGYHVLVPDIFNGDSFIEGGSLEEWLPSHLTEVTSPIIDGFFSQLNASGKFDFIGAVGYCFGGKYAIRQLASGKYATAAAVAHPSFVTIDEVAAVTKPLIISAAEVDSIFTVELRHQTEAKLTEIGATYQLDLFSKVSHGYSVRGDLTDSFVTYAKEKTLNDHVQWFNLF